MPNSLYSDLCDVYDEGKKPYLFISYSHEDTTSVVAAIRALQRVGYRIWYDMGISAGAQWPEDVADHIFGCDAVLAFMTPNSILSDNCREELFYAKKLKKNILLAYLQECDLSHGMDMRLGTLQFIDRRRCRDDEEFYTRLAKAKILQPCRGDTEGGTAKNEPAPEESPTGLQDLRERAKDGDAQAQYELGNILQYGIGADQNSVEAFCWYEKAAEQKLPTAIRAVGLCYEYGQGVPKDVNRAAELYLQASTLGCAAATNSLGYCYEMGIGVERNIGKAVELYTEAALENDPYAQQNLAFCYEYKKGVDQDWSLAVYWYRRAAEQSVAYSQLKLAECYRKGLGVPMDEVEAAHWQKLYDENPNK